MLQSLVNISSKMLCGHRLCVLTYHRVLAEKDPLRPFEPSAKQFETQLAVLRKAFNIIRLDAAVEMLFAGRLPRRALAITFDDGYRDNHDIALPILLRQGVPATFFVATRFLNGGEMFNDVVIEAVRNTALTELKLAWLPDRQRLSLIAASEKLAAIKAILPVLKKLPLAERTARLQELVAELGGMQGPRQMMLPSEVQALHRSGMEIGGHTVNHPILASLDENMARLEIQQCRAELEAILQAPVNGFAYPNGRPELDYDKRHVNLAREVGFGYAVSTRWASADGEASRFELPRIAPWDQSAHMFALRVARAYKN